MDIKNNENIKNELIILNNLFISNNVSNYLNFLYEINDIEKYINNWFKLIRINITKLLKKQNNIIKEVIEDFNYSTEYPISESMIYNFDEYIKNNMK
jgi:hypothetical protein